jgi:hypothetical protein
VLTENALTPRAQAAVKQLRALGTAVDVDPNVVGHDESEEQIHAAGTGAAAVVHIEL